MTGNAMLSISGLHSGYGASMVLNGVDLQVSTGEIYAILGKNGMGKTTLLKTLMGFIRPRLGEIRFGDTPVTHWLPERIARHRIAYISQEKALFQDLSVKNNLELALHNNKEFSLRFAEIADYFPFLKDRLQQKAGTLSGGEQKMLLVARALMTRPALILIDEITEGLQPSVIEKLTLILRNHSQSFGTTLLLVEQNISFTLATADRYSILDLGTFVDTGHTGESGIAARIFHHFVI